VLVVLVVIVVILVVASSHKAVQPEAQEDLLARLRRLNPINITPAQLDAGAEYNNLNNGKKIFLTGFLTVNKPPRDSKFGVGSIYMH